MYGWGRKILGTVGLGGVNLGRAAGLALALEAVEAAVGVAWPAGLRVTDKGPNWNQSFLQIALCYKLCDTGHDI